MTDANNPDAVRETAAAYLTGKALLTYEDYCRTPDDERYELLEGVLYKMTPAPRVFHQEVSKRLGRWLLAWVEDRGLGKVYFAPIDVVLSLHNVLQPDLLLVARERLDIIHEANIQGAPDLVVEILSPYTAAKDCTKKRQLYGRFGVRELWLVNPASCSIEVATSSAKIAGAEPALSTWQVFGAGTTMQSKFLSGFTLDMQALFAPWDAPAPPHTSPRR